MIYNDDQLVGVERTAELTETFSQCRANRVARNAVTSANLQKVARNPVRMREYSDTYGISVKRTGKVTNQRQSGRCWNFAALNVVRHAAFERLDTDDFELSQAYGMFYDKLEKANAALEYVIEMIFKPTDSRELSYVLDWGMGDGGYFPFSMNLLAKWGTVPKYAMPETACSKASGQMNRQLERLVRRSAAVLRAMAKNGASMEELFEAKQGMLEDVHKVLCVCLGEPPLRFDVRLPIGPKAQVPEDKIVVVQPEEAEDDEAGQGATASGGDAAPVDAGDEPIGVAGGAEAQEAGSKARRFVVDEGVTPQEFLERYVGFDPSDYVDLINVPLDAYPFELAYHPTLTDTVIGGEPVRMLNMPDEVLEDAAVASLRAGEPCIMSCDVMQNLPREIEDFPGVLALDTMDYEDVLGVELDMDRARLIEMRETSLTHCMVFQGVQLGADGRPVAWRVENSWGEKACKAGYLIVDADWFRLFGGEVVVKREFVPAEVRKLWDEAEVRDVAPWSGIGAAMGGARR